MASIEQMREFWPEWQIEDQIGEGSYGKVYRAKRLLNDEVIYSAIKVITIPYNKAEISTIRAEGMDELSARSYYKGIVDDCLNEIKAMESLKGTANIVNVEDYKVIEHKGEIGWDIYIRMELLTSFISYTANKQLNQSEVIKFGIDICKALECCSKVNIIHRDIKPENIFISKFGDYKLGDFGISKKLETTAALSQKGTYFYMAPEVYRGQAYSSNVDTYSLGIVLYKLLNNNKLPFLDPNKSFITYKEREAALARRLGGEPLPAPCYASGPLASVILKACSFNPAARFQSPSEMKAALIAAGNSVAALGDAMGAGYMGSDSGTVVMNGPGAFVGNMGNSAMDNRFMGNGAMQNGAMEQYSTMEGDHSAANSPKKEGGKSKVVILIVAIVACVLLIAGTIVGVMYFKNSNKDDEDTKDRVEREDEEDSEGKKSWFSEDEEETPVPEEPAPEDSEVVQQPIDEAVATPAPSQEVPSATDAIAAQSVDGIVYLADVYEYLTLRSQPSTSAEPITLLPAYTRMYITEFTNDTMVKVILEDNSTGYVNRNYITPEGSAMQRAGQTQTETVTDTTIYYANVEEFLTLRNAPSTSAEAIDYLPPYAAMYVIEWSGKMAKVVVIETGQVGYVNGDYITTN